MDDQKKTVFFIDDDMTNLKIGRNNLSGHFQIVTAASGEKLFSLLEKLTPALIVLDIEMPEMNGYQVFEKLRSDEKTSNIPVLFLSAKDDVFLRPEGFSGFRADFEKKPFSKEVLIERINTMIAKYDATDQ